MKFVAWTKGQRTVELQSCSVMVKKRLAERGGEAIINLITRGQRTPVSGTGKLIARTLCKNTEDVVFTYAIDDELAECLLKRNWEVTLITYSSTIQYHNLEQLRRRLAEKALSLTTHAGEKPDEVMEVDVTKESTKTAAK